MRNRADLIYEKESDYHRSGYHLFLVGGCSSLIKSRLLIDESKKEILLCTSHLLFYADSVGSWTASGCKYSFR